MQSGVNPLTEPTVSELELQEKEAKERAYQAHME